ncbi:hypothetical protein Tco_1236817 [Tanacetum coccineum]
MTVMFRNKYHSLHGISTRLFAIVIHQETAKDIWDRESRTTNERTELSYQDVKCRLYNLFDKFAYVQGETLYEYYWRFSQLINDMHINGMTMQQLDSGLAVPTFQQGEDDCLHHNRKAFLLLSHLVYSAKEAKKFCIWFKEKLMLAEAQEAGQILDEEQLAFIADPDLDAYNSDCDDISSAKAVLMANLSSCDADVLSEVPYSDTYLNDMINQEVQEMSYSE